MKCENICDWELKVFLIDNWNGICLRLKCEIVDIIDVVKCMSLELMS